MIQGKREEAAIGRERNRLEKEQNTLIRELKFGNTFLFFRKTGQAIGKAGLKAGKKIGKTAIKFAKRIDKAERKQQASQRKLDRRKPMKRKVRKSKKR